MLYTLLEYFGLIVLYSDSIADVMLDGYFPVGGFVNGI